MNLSHAGLFTKPHITITFDKTTVLVGDEDTNATTLSLDVRVRAPSICNFSWDEIKQLKSNNEKMIAIAVREFIRVKDLLPRIICLRQQGASQHFSQRPLQQRCVQTSPKDNKPDFYKLCVPIRVTN